MNRVFTYATTWCPRRGPDVAQRGACGRGADLPAAVDDATGEVLGTVTGSTTALFVRTRRTAPACWSLAVDPARPRPGVVAEPLVRTLLDHVPGAGPGLRRPLGDARQPAGHPALREARLRPGADPGDQAEERDQRAAVHRRHRDLDDLNPYARIIADEAMRRGIWVEVLDAESGEMRLDPRRSQRDHPRIAVRVHLGGRDVPLRRQAVDPAAASPRRALPCRAPVWPRSTTRRLRTSCEEVGEVVVKPTRGEQGRGITVGVLADKRPRRACRGPVAAPGSTTRRC